LVTSLAETNCAVRGAAVGGLSVLVMEEEVTASALPGRNPADLNRLQPRRSLTAKGACEKRGKPN